MKPLKEIPGILPLKTLAFCPYQQYQNKPTTI